MARTVPKLPSAGELKVRGTSPGYIVPSRQEMSSVGVLHRLAKVRFRPQSPRSELVADAPVSDIRASHATIICHWLPHNPNAPDRPIAMITIPPKPRTITTCQNHTGLARRRVGTRAVGNSPFRYPFTAAHKNTAPKAASIIPPGCKIAPMFSPRLSANLPESPPRRTSGVGASRQSHSFPGRPLPGIKRTLSRLPTASPSRS